MRTCSVAGIGTYVLVGDVRLRVLRAMAHKVVCVAIVFVTVVWTVSERGGRGVVLSSSRDIVGGKAPDKTRACQSCAVATAEVPTVAVVVGLQVGRPRCCECRQGFRGVVGRVVVFARHLCVAVVECKWVSRGGEVDGGCLVGHVARFSPR